MRNPAWLSSRPVRSLMLSSAPRAPWQGVCSARAMNALGEGLSPPAAGAALRRDDVPTGSGSPQARREGASRIQIHNLQPADARASSRLARDAVSSARPSPLDSPGAKLAAEMLVRKASLVTHARRLAQGGRPARARPRADPRRLRRASSRSCRWPGAAASASRRRRAVERRSREAVWRRSARSAPARKRVANPAAPPKSRPAPGEGGAAEALRQPHLSASPAHAAFRAAPAAGAGGQRGRARAECAAARGRARGFRRARRDHECEARARSSRSTSSSRRPARNPRASSASPTMWRAR